MLPWHDVVAQTGAESSVMGVVLASGADDQCKLIVARSRTVYHVQSQVQIQYLVEKSRTVSHVTSQLVVEMN